MSHDATLRLLAAQRYERDLVPAAFAESARELADAADVGRGDRALDVACGTGVGGQGVFGSGKMAVEFVSPAHINAAAKVT